MKMFEALRSAAVITVFSLAVLSATAAWQYTELKQFGHLDQGGQDPHAAVTRAQDGMLYGTTAEGGIQNQGTIYKISQQGAGFQVLHSFTNGYIDGSSPQTPMLEGSDGYLYGTTYNGGVEQVGVAFKISKNGMDYQILHSFGVPISDGWRPQGPLLESSDGNFFGMTGQGGAHVAGVIFKFSKTGEYEVIHDFDFGTSGTSNPLIEAHDGKLYGTLSVFSEYGAIFRINKDGTGFEILHRFAGADGISPNGALILAPDGHLTGITTAGGALGGGTYFRINKDGSGFRILRNFASGNGNLGSLIRLNDRFYGISVYGGVAGSGNLFSLDPADGSFKFLTELTNTNDIANPVALSAVGSVIYAVASDKLFEFFPATGKYQIIHKFDLYGGDGIHPLTKPVFGPDGKLYGTTGEAGSGGVGTIYSIATDGSGYKTTWTFMNGMIGQFPSGLIVDGKGALYGATVDGGKLKKTLSRGTVFRLDAKGRYKTLHAFAGLPDDGEFPNTPLLEGRDGALYGSAQFGEYSGVGTRNAIFSVDKNGHDYHVLCVLTNSSVYYFYMSQLSEGTNGKLFGAFVDTAFTVNKDGSGYQPLHVFPTGQYTTTPLLPASDGKLYGATRLDGVSHVGQIYRVNEDGSGFEVIFTFPKDYSLGGNPKGALVEGADGMLYGVAPGSLTPEIFRLNKDGTGFEILYVFDHSAPGDGLTLGPDGAWYGTTINGGQFGLGSIFKLNFVPDALP
jgi:uncharacterized repeat protein (TIGR03803 family)